jgi:hypothetical protein
MKMRRDRDEEQRQKLGEARALGRGGELESGVEWRGASCSGGGAHPFIGAGGGPERRWSGGNGQCYGV